MVQSPNPWNRDDLTHFSRFDRPLFRSILLESEVGSVFVAIGDIRSNHSAELRLVDRNHVIQAVLPKAGNPPFSISVLPGRSESCANLLEAKPINSITKLCPLDLVIVTNQETPRQTKPSNGTICQRL